MYCSVNTAMEKARGTEDMYNSVAAAVTTGALFKSTGKYIVCLLFLKQTFLAKDIKDFEELS